MSQKTKQLTLDRPPLDAEAQAAADQRDAAVHAETVAEIRAQQADKREARTSQEVVVGPTRNPTQAPNAGEPGHSATT